MFITTFNQTLTQYLYNENIHVDLGGFNINAQDQANHLEHKFSDYQQILTEPTQISGAILDHVYLKNDFIECFDVQTFIKTVFFSDHDAVQLS